MKQLKFLNKKINTFKLESDLEKNIHLCLNKVSELEECAMSFEAEIDLESLKIELTQTAITSSDVYNELISEFSTTIETFEEWYEDTKRDTLKEEIQEEFIDVLSEELTELEDMSNIFELEDFYSKISTLSENIENIINNR